MRHKSFKFVILTSIITFLWVLPAVSDAQQLTRFETGDFSGSGICAFCHSNLTDQAGNDVSNDAQWRSTMMANAAKDPLWQAKISAEVDLVPTVELEQVIQEKCSRCHMGMARYQALTDGAQKTEIFVLENDTGFLDQAHYLHDAAMDGVSCTLCHQIQPGNLGSLDSFTGQYEIDTAPFRPDRVLFGPYANPRLNPMQRNSGFLPTHHAPGLQLADSAHCGSCHTLYTPALDADGEYLKEFPEQTTYLEWAYSQFNKTCQDCHLPKAEGKVVISNRPRNLKGRAPFGQHHYVGGNSFMVDLLKTNAASLGVTAEDLHLDATISRTLAQLKNATATVTAAGSLSATGDRLNLTVDVVNLAGHKFPSGIPSRRAWLHVMVVDSNNTLIFESGKPREDGSIQGNDADTDPSVFEPHYDLITDQNQVQIYEPVMRNFEKEVTYTLLRAHEYIKDNRLLPNGFHKINADPDIAVYGAAAGDTNFTGGSDQIHYDVDVTTATGDLTVTVELLFQALSFTFVNDLADVQTDLVANFMNLYRQAQNVPVVVGTPTQITVSKETEK